MGIVVSKKKVSFVMSFVEVVTPTCYFIAGNKDLPLSDTHLKCAFVKCGVAA